MELMQETALFTSPPVGKRSSKRQTVPLSLWVKPALKAEIQHMATQEGLSVSAIGGAALASWVRQSIHGRQEALLYPKLRQLIREERQASDNRIMFFLMRIAFAGEQGRILITNILDRILRRDQTPESTFVRLVDQSSTMARRNIIKKTPQLKTLLDEWDASLTDSREEGSGKRTDSYGSS